MTRVKICGITNLQDALLAAKLGADVLGFNFYPKSPRFIKPEHVKEIVDELPRTVQTAGVLVNESVEAINKIADLSGVDIIQLHGDEDTDLIAALTHTTSRSVIKAVRVKNELDVDEVLAFGADAILLDSFSPNGYGGSGNVFDWTLARQLQNSAVCLYLAGGMTAENVAEAIRQVGPFAVDVASGVESEPGRKDPVKLARFIENARSV